MFSTDVGSSTNVFYTTCDISSDDSLIPIPSVSTVYNVFKPTANSPSSFYKPSSGEYLKIFLRKAAETSTISRSYQKLDTMLSNVGGLFSIIIMLFQLPLYYYNAYCYELSLASDLFRYQRNEDAKPSAGGGQSQQGPQQGQPSWQQSLHPNQNPSLIRKPSQNPLAQSPP